MAKNSTTVTAKRGIGFPGLLTVVFITLKLTGVIDWRWLWVLAPLWISFTIGFVIVFMVLALYLWAVWDKL